MIEKFFRTFFLDLLKFGSKMTLPDVQLDNRAMRIPHLHYDKSVYVLFVFI